MSAHPAIIFSTVNYEYLRDEMQAIGSYEVGLIERNTFADGERYTRILSTVQGRNVILLGGTVSETDTLELFDLGCAMAKYGAQRLAIVIPYYGYQTMERASKSGEIVTAKTRARLFSVIPKAVHGNTILMLDLHAEGIPHYFEGEVMTKHVYAKPVVIDAIKKNAPTDFVLASVDAGRAKWVQSLANDMHVPASFALKQRTGTDKTELVAVSAHVEDKDVVIYDDMIRSGGSLINAGRAYADAGARSITAIATHGVLPGESLTKLKDSKLFKRVICTNSHPQARRLEDDFLKVVSIAHVLVDNIEAGIVQ